MRDLKKHAKNTLLGVKGFFEKICERGRLKNMYKEYSIVIAQRLHGRIKRVSKTLGVSRQSLVVFLLLNAYDRLCSLEKEERNRRINEALKNADRDKKKAIYDAEADRLKKGKSEESVKEKKLVFRASEFVDDFITNWKDESEPISEGKKNNVSKGWHKEKKQWSKKDIAVALLYIGWEKVDCMLNGYLGNSEIEEKEAKEAKEAKSRYEKDRANFLACLGIKDHEFSRLASADALFHFFRNTSDEVRCRQAYGCLHEFEVYQLKDKQKRKELLTLSYAEVQQRGIKVQRKQYDLICRRKMRRQDNEKAIRERLSNKENIPRYFSGHCMGAGDVLVLYQDGTHDAYYVDREGFVLLNDFI